MAHSIQKPLIGITPEYDESGTGFSKMPWFAVRKNHAEAVVQAGGIPIILPHEPSMIEHFIHTVDGIIITGGDFDVPPSFYGQEVRYPSMKFNPKRTAFEYHLLQKALEKDMPVLGICNGQQLIAVHFGATLFQHIPDEFETSINHEQPNPRTESGHTINVVPGTKLAHCLKGSLKHAVNSAHHQAVADPGDTLIVNAYAEDGLIEGIEHPRHTFCIGVEWHPEYLIGPGDLELHKAFIATCRT